MAEKRNIDEIAREVIDKYMAEKQGNGSETGGASLEKSREIKNRMRNKAIIVASIGCVITACMFYIGFAWYTRISNIHVVTFDVAEYELAVNDNTDNEFLVNVYEYSNVKNKTAAPGTAGYIPIKLSARHSAVSVDFSITWGNLMITELQKHIRFFYLVDGGGNPIVCDLNEDGKTVVDDHKKYFLTSPSSSNPAGTSKKYLTETSTIQGVVNMYCEKVIYIYWEWYLDADAAYGAGALEAGVTVDDAYRTAWDAFDTDIGRYPEKYRDGMFVKIHCVGVQSVPDLETKSN